MRKAPLCYFSLQDSYSKWQKSLCHSHLVLLWSLLYLQSSFRNKATFFQKSVKHVTPNKGQVCGKQKPNLAAFCNFLRHNSILAVALDFIVDVLQGIRTSKMLMKIIIKILLLTAF